MITNLGKLYEAKEVLEEISFWSEKMFDLGLCDYQRGLTEKEQQRKEEYEKRINELTMKLSMLLHNEPGLVSFEYPEEPTTPYLRIRDDFYGITKPI